MVAQVRVVGIRVSTTIQKRATVSGVPNELEHVRAVLRASDNSDSAATRKTLKEGVTQQLRSTKHALVATTCDRNGEEQGVTKHVAGCGNNVQDKNVSRHRQRGRRESKCFFTSYGNTGHDFLQATAPK